MAARLRAQEKAYASWFADLQGELEAIFDVSAAKTPPAVANASQR